VILLIYLTTGLKSRPGTEKPPQRLTNDLSR